VPRGSPDGGVPAFTANELARWALKPVHAVAIHGNGHEAHVQGPDLSASLGSQALTDLITDLAIKWPHTRN
jgi:hypothetical protein